MLARLYTDLYIGNKPLLGKLAGAISRHSGHAGLKRLLGRTSDVPAHLVRSFDLMHLRHFSPSLRAHGKGLPSQWYLDYGGAFARHVVRNGFAGADTVYGFNGASEAIFAAARAQGLACVLDQTIVPMPAYRRIMQAEIDRWPGWQPGLELMSDDDPLIARDVAEWKLADIIVCGSPFLARAIGIAGGPEAKCRVVPYGFDRPLGARDNGPRPPIDGPLKLLFVGEVGLRKGVPYLLDALRRLPAGRVEMRFAGSVHLAAPIIEQHRDVAAFLGAVPRAGMAGLYGWADAMVLPSLVEGSSMATYEALQYGLPVICTPNAGSIVEDGVDGFLVEPGSATAIVAAIERLPSLIAERAASGAALGEGPTFESYRLALLSALASLPQRVVA